MTCAHCGVTLDESDPRADEDAHAEAMANWGCDGRSPGMVVICDDCYRRFIVWADTQGLVRKAGNA